MKVIIIAAMTLCGRISPAPLAGVEDRRLLEKIRSETDAGLMGAETLRVEDPEMRGSFGLDPNRVRAIMTLSGRIPLSGKKLFDGAGQPVIFTGNKAFDDLHQKFKSKAQVVELPMAGTELSLVAALDFLEKCDVRSVLIEGGGRLNYSALRQGVVNELMVTIAPRLSGDGHAALLVNGKTALGMPFLELELLASRISCHGELFTHYRVNN